MQVSQVLLNEVYVKTARPVHCKDKDDSHQYVFLAEYHKFCMWHSTYISTQTCIFTVNVVVWSVDNYQLVSLQVFLSQQSPLHKKLATYHQQTSMGNCHFHNQRYIKQWIKPQ